MADIRISQGGGGGTPDDNSVSTAKIVDAAVTQPKLADASVGSAQIIDSSVSGNDIAANSILPGHLNSLSLGVDLSSSQLVISGFKTFVGGIPAGLSVPCGFGSERLGSGAGFTAGQGILNTFLGYYTGFSNASGKLNFYGGALAGKNCTGNSNVFLGASAAEATGNMSRTVCIGASSVVSNGDSVVLGNTASSTGGNSVVIGYAATSTGGTSILLGTSATNSLSNVLVAGSSSFPINDLYFGKGSSNNTPTTYTIHGTNGAVAAIANTIGGGLVFAPGIPTGNGRPGQLQNIYGACVPGATTAGNQSIAYTIPTTMCTGLTSGVSSNNAVSTSLMPPRKLGDSSIISGMLTVGRNIRFCASGYHNATTVPGTLNLTYKLGPFNLASTGAQALTGSLVNGYWKLEVDTTIATVGTSGTALCTGAFTGKIDPATNIGYVWSMVNTNQVQIDTTRPLEIDLLALYGTADAANYIVNTNTVIEILN